MTTKRKFRRQVGWGEALVLEVHYRSPGLKPVVDAIQKAVGDVGTRNTFAKLFDVIDEPVGKDRWRAWLLLTALGQDPSEWNIGDDVVPPAYDPDKLRTLVRSWSPWITACAGQLPLFAVA